MNEKKSSKEKKKWKDALLSSGLPLEYEIAEVLKKFNYEIKGEYPYSRKNEKGIYSERSVDIYAVKKLYHNKNRLWGRIHLLIECKYSHENKYWVFSLLPEEQLGYQSFINIFDSFARNIPKNGLICNINTKRCFKGVEIKNNDHKKGDETSIKSGIHQLKFAIPKLVSTVIENQFNIYKKNESLIDFCGLILATTADLWVLNKDTTINKIKKSNSLKEVMTNTKEVIISQKNGPELDSYIMEVISDLGDKIPDIEKMVKQVANLRSNETSIKKALSYDFMKFDILNSPNNVLLTNLENIETELFILTQTIENLKETVSEEVPFFNDKFTKELLDDFIKEDDIKN